MQRSPSPTATCTHLEDNAPEQSQPTHEKEQRRLVEERGRASASREDAGGYCQRLEQAARGTNCTWISKS